MASRLSAACQPTVSRTRSRGREEHETIRRLPQKRRALRGVGSARTFAYSRRVEGCATLNDDDDDDDDATTTRRRR